LVERNRAETQKCGSSQFLVEAPDSNRSKDNMADTTWKAIIENLGGSAILIAAIAWLIRSIVLHLLSKDVETYKRDLGRQVFEHEVRFQRMHEKQAEVISELYSLLFEFYSRVNSYVSIMDFEGEPSKDGKRELCKQAGIAVLNHINPKRLYLPNETHRKVLDFTNKLIQVMNKFTEGLDSQNRGEPYSGHWHLWQTVTKEANPLFEQIHSDFQELIGVHTRTQIIRA
jgi:hypothetical protein